MTNEEFIARYSDWRPKYRQNFTDEEIAEELAFISELAKFMAPIPLYRATKAVQRDYYDDYKTLSMERLA